MKSINPVVYDALEPEVKIYICPLKAEFRTRSEFSSREHNLSVSVIEVPVEVGATGEK